MLKVFQNMSSSEKDFIPQLKKIWASLEEHMKDEEQDDLPALKKELSTVDGESESMAKSFGRTKVFVPSRSHPAAGEEKVEPRAPFATSLFEENVSVARIVRNCSSRINRTPG